MSAQCPLATRILLHSHVANRVFKVSFYRKLICAVTSSVLTEHSLTGSKSGQPLSTILVVGSGVRCTLPSSQVAARDSFDWKPGLNFDPPSLPSQGLPRGERFPLEPCVLTFKCGSGPDRLPREPFPLRVEKRFQDPQSTSLFSPVAIWRINMALIFPLVSLHFMECGKGWVGWWWWWCLSSTQRSDRSVKHCGTRKGVDTVRLPLPIHVC